MYEYISSKSNEKIKTVRKIADKKYRQRLGVFAIEGQKLVFDYLRSGGVPVRIFADEDAAEKYSSLIEAAHCGEVCVVPRELYLYISEESAPQGIMALCPIPAQGSLKPGRSVILESVRDAGNLGTVIRTAVAFGIENVVLSSDCADIYNSKTLRAAMGALFFANVITADDLPSFVAGIRESGGRVFASVPSGDALDIRKVSIKDGDCVVIGNEGSGISAALADACDARVTIPMAGRTESLNASAAASVLMWELVREGVDR